MKYYARVLAVIAITYLFYPSFGFAQIALSLDQGDYSGTPVAGSTHGWEFSVAEVFNVPELGLYDHMNDGFLDVHEVGIFRESDGQILTSGMLSPGTGDTLIDNFRYVSVPAITLHPNVEYVVAYHSTIDPLIESGDIIAISDPVNLSFHPSVNYLGSRFRTDNGFAMPESVAGGAAPYRFGPNFSFTAVPEPGSAGIFLGALVVLARRRR